MLNKCTYDIRKAAEEAAFTLCSTPSMGMF